MSMRRLLAIIVLFAALAVGCEREPSRVEPGNGKDFVLNDLDGNPVRLSDFGGKVVMLEFWATWCPPCRLAMPDIIALYEEYHDRGFEIIAISLDESPAAVRKFADEFGMKFPVVMDQSDVNAAFKVYNIPTAVILDRQGKEVARHLGYPRDFRKMLGEEIETLLGKNP